MITSNVLELGTLFMGLFGGLALFLFGMEQMTDALKLEAGGGMKRLLGRLTTNRVKAAFAGAAVTAVIQSSSVTTVLVVGFISAGLMSLTQSIGIILGANIGTTVTAQIIAFKVTKYSLVLIAAGFGLTFLSKRQRVKNYGAMAMGLGLIFFGMEMMSTATQPLRTYEPFINMMRRMENPILGILVSAGFTGLIQSSSATTGIIIVLAGQGFITLEAGVALVFGANIGTCVTALLAAIGKPREAVQAAAVHIIFNIAGVLLWLGLIDQLAWVIREVSPVSTSLQGLERLAKDTPRQIANAHTVFNVINTFVFLWFTKPLGRLVEYLIPISKEKEEDGVQPKYLDEILLQTPVIALDRVRMEMRRLGERAYDMVERALAVATHGSKEEIENLIKRDDEVDALHGAIVKYLGALSQENLNAKQSRHLSLLLSAANNIENIGDMVESNIMGAGQSRLESGLTFSEATEAKLVELHAKVCWALQLTLQALDASDAGMAEQVIHAKSSLNQLAKDLEFHLANRLTAEAEGRVALFKTESEIIEYLKRVYYFSKSISKSIVAFENGSHSKMYERDSLVSSSGNV